ncbi:MAG: hypothetical protein ACTSQE_07415 [Candidatus Heimdallarchaeaceae archaeon]
MKKVYKKLYDKNKDGFSLADNFMLLVVLLYFTGGLFNLDLYQKYGYIMSLMLMILALFPILNEWDQKPTGLFRLILVVLSVRVALYSYLVISITFGGPLYNFLWKPYDALVIMTLYLFTHKEMWNKRA